MKTSNIIFVILFVLFIFKTYAQGNKNTITREDSLLEQYNKTNKPICLEEFKFVQKRKVKLGDGSYNYVLILREGKYSKEKLTYEINVRPSGQFKGLTAEIVDKTIDETTIVSLINNWPLELDVFDLYKGLEDEEYQLFGSLLNEEKLQAQQQFAQIIKRVKKELQK